MLGDLECFVLMWGVLVDPHGGGVPLVLGCYRIYSRETKIVSSVEPGL